MKNTIIKQNNKRSKKLRRDRILAIITLISLLFAGVIGFNKDMADISGKVLDMVPGATHFVQSDFEEYRVFNDSSKKAIAFVGISKYNGFGGPMKVATSVDTLGNIIDILIVDHKETPSWFKRVIGSKLIPQLKEKNYFDNFIIGEDIEALTGATYTTRAISENVKSASRELSSKFCKLPKPIIDKKSIEFGVPEMVLIILLLIGAFGIRKASPKNKKRIRWLTMLTGLSVIGFWINHPLTLVDINKLIMGYLPDYHNQLYWYILIFGTLLIFLTTNKNVYCAYICPFGAAQECLALVAKAKTTKSKQLLNITKWLRRLFVWGAISLALIMRNPGFSSYEVYGTLFTLSGTNLAVLFLVIILVAALFIKRPWCNFLCPVPAIEDFVRLLKNYGKELMSKIRRTLFS